MPRRARWQGHTHTHVEGVPSHVFDEDWPDFRYAGLLRDGGCMATVELGE